MIDRIDASLAFQAEALKLRAHRQQVLAGNIANADTPHYQAVDFDFAKALAEATEQRAAASSSTTQPLAAPEIALLPRVSAKSALDGNTVDMDTERLQFVDNALRYEAALRFINGKIKTLLSAIQG
jgi:flagellar basal-body rod protein FlgB